MGSASRSAFVCGALLAACILPGCSSRDSGAAPKPAPAGDSPGAWTASQVAVLEGFRVPECVFIDPTTGMGYVSNIDAAEGAYWADDGKAFISMLKAGGELDTLRWRESTTSSPLNAPKGMCMLDANLYVADNTVVRRYPLGGGAPQEIKVPGAQRLNDMAADGKFAYVSDTGAGKVFRLGGRPAEIAELKAPKGVNGITFHKAGMFGVSWDLHEVYELDPAGKADPKPFGLADRFRSLDGVEVLADGTFIVSDFVGGRVCAIGPDRRTVSTLAELASPADIGLDRQRMLLFVPQFEKDKVVVFRLQKAPGK